MPEVEEKQNQPPLTESDPEIEEMFRAGLYLGYSRTRRHPKMRPYIFGLRNNIEVFDLEKTRNKLHEAQKFLKEIGASGGTFLLVGSKPSAAFLIEKAGTELGMPYSARRWPGGLLTNFGIIRKRLDYLEDLKEKKESGELAKYTKKEQLVLSDEIKKLEQKFAGLVSLRKVPDAVLIIDTKEEKTATSEVLKMNIKTVGVMNIDCDPDSAEYIIPANDSAQSSIKYILDKLVDAFKSGIQARAAKEVTQNQSSSSEEVVSDKESKSEQNV